MCLFSDSSDLICMVPFVFPGRAIIPTLPILFFFFSRVVPSFRPYPYYFSFSMGLFHQFELSYIISIF
ncbi:hypothetical protein H5410_020645 [Solanum commersonii]|uniref:Uncharacterized protein n=1 Tax=Solanum commersonii TaxID=4109 RepID=A0A9J5ZCZ7_SOLCO|nr:hypothetical protein H5410_020645 [Solanum commersonii]